MQPTTLVPIERTDETGRRYMAQEFTYAIVFNSLTGQFGQRQGQIQVQADSAFVVLAQTFSFWDEDANVFALPRDQLVVPDISVLITNTGSGRQLMNTPVRIEEKFGTAQLPYILPSPQFFQPNAAMQVAIFSQKNFGGDSYSLALSFHGEKRFYL